MRRTRDERETTRIEPRRPHTHTLSFTYPHWPAGGGGDQGENQGTGTNSRGGVTHSRVRRKKRNDDAPPSTTPTTTHTLTTPPTTTTTTTKQRVVCTLTHVLRSPVCVRACVTAAHHAVKFTYETRTYVHNSSRLRATGAARHARHTTQSDEKPHTCAERGGT